MVGETDENWKRCIRKTLELQPDSVTIYQMEIPYNTTIFKDMKAQGRQAAPIAGWETKREWVNYAFDELESAGYTVTSGYTAFVIPKKLSSSTVMNYGPVLTSSAWELPPSGISAAFTIRTTPSSINMCRKWRTELCLSHALSSPHRRRS